MTYIIMERKQDIDVVKHIGGASLSELGTTASIYKCHRCYQEGSDPFSGEEWKYYEWKNGEPKRCQTYGKNKDGSGYCRGFSMWDPHCFPKSLLDKRNGLKVKCKLLSDADNLPVEFKVLSDRTFDAVVGGNNINFTHYLLTPSRQCEEDDINTACGNLITHDCDIEACVEPTDLSFIDFDDCERAVGAMYAGQCALKNLVDDPENSVSERCDALVLYAWLGSLEASIDELVDLSPWASGFILQCLKKYGPDLSDSNLILSFGDALGSLQYQLQHSMS